MLIVRFVVFLALLSRVSAAATCFHCASQVVQGFNGTQGPIGPAGPAGPTGPAGPAGSISGPVTDLELITPKLTGAVTGSPSFSSLSSTVFTSTTCTGTQTAFTITFSAACTFTIGALIVPQTTGLSVVATTACSACTTVVVDATQTLASQSFVIRSNSVAIGSSSTMSAPTLYTTAIKGNPTITTSTISATGLATLNGGITTSGSIMSPGTTLQITGLIDTVSLSLPVGRWPVVMSQSGNIATLGGSSTTSGFNVGSMIHWPSNEAAMILVVLTTKTVMVDISQSISSVAVHVTYGHAASGWTRRTLAAPRILAVALQPRGVSLAETTELSSCTMSQTGTVVTATTCTFTTFAVGMIIMWPIANANGAIILAMISGPGVTPVTMTVDADQTIGSTSGVSVSYATTTSMSRKSIYTPRVMTNDVSTGTLAATTITGSPVITTPKITHFTGPSTFAIAVPTTTTEDVLVLANKAQTLTSKTLENAVFTGADVLEFPAGITTPALNWVSTLNSVNVPLQEFIGDTFVTTDMTQTLQRKTLASPILTGDLVTEPLLPIQYATTDCLARHNYNELTFQAPCTPAMFVLGSVVTWHPTSPDHPGDSYPLTTEHVLRSNTGKVTMSGRGPSELGPNLEVIPLLWWPITVAYDDGTRSRTVVSASGIDVIRPSSTTITATLTAFQEGTSLYFLFIDFDPIGTDMIGPGAVVTWLDPSVPLFTEIKGGTALSKGVLGSIPVLVMDYFMDDATGAAFIGLVTVTFTTAYTVQTSVTSQAVTTASLTATTLDVTSISNTVGGVIDASAANGIKARVVQGTQVASGAWVQTPGAATFSTVEGSYTTLVLDYTATTSVEMAPTVISSLSIGVRLFPTAVFVSVSCTNQKSARLAVTAGIHATASLGASASGTVVSLHNADLIVANAFAQTRWILTITGY